MELIAITVPYFYEHESSDIVALLKSKRFSRLHIRKPGASELEIKSLLSAIPAELRPKISLHDCFDIAQEFGVGGVHLNSRNPLPPRGWSGLLSRSLHSVDQIAGAKEDYLFLSPIFPSISKPGYTANFNFGELKKKIGHKVYALGGVTPENLHIISSLGFGGAAMLGAVWRPRIISEQFRLQLITNGDTVDETVAGAMKALAGGCRWIQVRMKDSPLSDVEEAVSRLSAKCREHDAVLLVDDHVELAARLDCIHGVHIGKNDMPVTEARRLLGPGKIIGATANTFADLEKAVADGADYVGVGPFRFTTTKKNLSPVLGLQGYTEIIAECASRGLTVPVVAIGGIELPDVFAIISAGVNGVAVSGTILRAENPAAMTSRLVETLELSLKNQKK